MKVMNYLAVLLVKRILIINVVRQNSGEKGLSMNVEKTEMVVCHNEMPIVINGQVLEQEKKLKYLGNGLQTMVDVNVRLRIE